jgi:translation initiation factor IF-1
VIGAIQPGDRMELELSPFDLSRGRIIGRCSDTESVPDSAP